MQRERRCVKACLRSLFLRPENRRWRHCIHGEKKQMTNRRSLRYY